jgi:hypothetical protein
MASLTGFVCRGVGDLGSSNWYVGYQPGAVALHTVILVELAVDHLRYLGIDKCCDARQERIRNDAATSEIIPALSIQRNKSFPINLDLTLYI